MYIVSFAPPRWPCGKEEKDKTRKPFAAFERNGGNVCPRGIPKVAELRPASIINTLIINSLYEHNFTYYKSRTN